MGSRMPYGTVASPSTPHQDYHANDVVLHHAAFDLPPADGSPQRPDHYTKYGVYEPILVIEAWDLDFHLGQVVKYVARHKDKGGLDDLKKARFYLERALALRGANA